MSQVTNALRQFIIGAAQNTEGGKVAAQQEAEANRLKAEQDYRKQQIAIETQRANAEQKAHEALAEYQKHQADTDLIHANVARAVHIAGLHTMGPTQLQRLPGVREQINTTGGENNANPLATPTMLEQTGSTFTLSPEVTGGGPETINAPTQENYLKNLAAEERAKKQPELDIANERNQFAVQKLQDTIEANQRLMELKTTSAADIAQLKAQNATYDLMLRGLQARDIANIRMGNTGDTGAETEQALQQLRSGQTSESDLKKLYGTRPGVYNSIVNGAAKEGLTIPTDKERDIVSTFGPAADAMRQMEEFNKARQEGIGLSNFNDLNNKQSQIQQALTTVERGLLNTRVSNLNVGQIIKGYSPSLVTGPFTDTDKSNNDKLANFAKYMKDILNKETNRLSPSQKQNVLDQTGISKYLPQQQAPVIKSGDKVAYDKLKPGDAYIENGIQYFKGK